jgi:glyoxylase-like metal-dependent hydrolase (beta-lactamase superfamily II)
MKVIPLSEGRFTVDVTKKFIPFTDGDALSERTKGSLLVEIQPFVVITEKDIILLDTGLGFSDMNGNLQLHNNMISAGVNPVDVTMILMSHLHKDHAGGITKKNPFSLERNICFPNARYVIHKNEFEASQQAGSSYLPEYILPLKNTEQLILTEESGTLDDYIQFEHTGGHSPWHQVFWIKEDNEIVFFGGDVAPQLVQLKTKFIAKYDYDGKKSAALRADWWERGNKEMWKFLFYHDINTPVYKAL